MPVRRPDPTPPSCPDRSPEARDALAALRANPGPDTAAAVLDAFSRPCDACGKNTCDNITEPVHLDWLRARLSDDAAGKALDAVMFPRTGAGW